jgi:DNA-binding NtrC family response regulator
MKQSRTILIVEDEHGTRELLKAQLEEDYNVRAVSNGEEAIAQIQSSTYDTVLLDLNLPGISGIEVLDRLGSLGEEAPTVVVVSADTNINTAVQALQRGAYDYLVKPFSVEELRKTLSRSTEHSRALSEGRIIRTHRSHSGKFAGMIGTSSCITRLKADIEKIACTRGTVLLTGESGTGKELAARAIHELSNRAKGPYIRINCAAIPESLLEAELFGHEKGAFTNAIARREGMFELAHGGTILLDEITEIDPSMQAKLLRVLQEREIMRLGGKKSINVDVRVIATTNRDLKTEVREGRFKEDLYYRLNVIPLHIAPLRERSEDIPALVEHFVQRAAEENECPVPELSEAAIQRLVSHPWPGNIRELENSLERSVILAESGVIDVADLRLDAEDGIAGTHADMNDASLTIRDMEKELILRRLNFTNGNRTRAAEMLGISVRTLRNKINQYRHEGITIPS